MSTLNGNNCKQKHVDRWKCAIFTIYIAHCSSRRRHLSVLDTGILAIFNPVLFGFQDDYVRAGLPLDFTADEYDIKDTSLLIALSLTVVCILVEFASIIGGISTFMTAFALLCK
jgi:hypothetical protein